MLEYKMSESEKKEYIEKSKSRLVSLITKPFLDKYSIKEYDYFLHSIRKSYNFLNGKQTIDIIWIIVRYDNPIDIIYENSYTLYGKFYEESVYDYNILYLWQDI